MYSEIRISQDMRDRAKVKYNKIKINSDRDKRQFAYEGKRLLYGYLGEIIIIDYYGVDDIDDYEYDIIIGEYKVDVKSISCKFKPPTNYLAAVNSCEIEGEHRQNSDVYIFVRIREDCLVGWILGFIECDRFFSMSEFIKKGEEYHGMKFEKANMNALPINRLHSIL